jgi:hypothetical protein
MRTITTAERTWNPTNRLSPLSRLHKGLKDLNGLSVRSTVMQQPTSRRKSLVNSIATLPKFLNHITFPANQWKLEFTGTNILEACVMPCYLVFSTQSGCNGNMHLSAYLRCLAVKQPNTLREIVLSCFVQSCNLIPVKHVQAYGFQFPEEK